MPLDEAYISAMIDERPDTGLYRVRRTMFTDPEIFDFEMKHIFESNWVYVAHESQVPKPNDFLTTKIGRQPIILTRLSSGKLSAVLNTCSHRGAMLTTKKAGNAGLFVCPFHAWGFRNDGKLLGCGDIAAAGYGPGFDKNNMNLKSVPRVESYRGCIFASLSDNVQSLPEYLGAVTTFLDLIVDQDPDGKIEIVPGPQSYTFKGNWKLQAENGVDGYHIGPIHGNYVKTGQNRHALAGANARVKPMDVSKFSDFPGGYYAFENGHVVLWNQSPNPEIRASWPLNDVYKQKFGEERAYWMNSCWRNLFIYPNVFIMDQMSTQIRVIQPISVDRTEVKTLCFAPASDTPALRTQRIRQYEDFFNAAGMATPDDLAAFNASQEGFSATNVEWSDISRGAQHLAEGADERADRLGFTPKYHGLKLEDEGIYLNQHHQWRDLMIQGLRSQQEN